MPTAKEIAPWAVGLTLVGIIGYEIISNIITNSNINSTPVTPGATGTGTSTPVTPTVTNANIPTPVTPTTMGITIGAIPTAGGGVNNPLDLRTSSILWQGKVTPAGSAFEQFLYMWYGYRAGIDTIKAHYNDYGQTTLNMFFAGNPSAANGGPGYAPASDNNTPAAYAQTVATAMGISPDADFGSALTSALMMSNMVTAMAQVEQGSSFVPNQNDITMALNNLGIS